jgi:YwiC-like protein
MMMSAGRRRSLIIPREHGAWGILLVPLVTGASVGLWAGGGARGLAPFSIVALALFWLRTPVESWIGSAPIRARTSDELRFVRNAALVLAIVSLSALIWLFWGGQNLALLGVGAAAGIAFLMQAILKRIWRRARTAAQMIGAAGLTSTAPAAYSIVTGHLDTTAWTLWVANLLFAINQIQFVQLRIHAAHTANRSEKLSAGRWFLIGQLILMALLAVACTGQYFRWYAAAAFLPVLFRGFAWFPARSEVLAIQALGKSELVYACAFGVVLVLGMHQP